MDMVMFKDLKPAAYKRFIDGLKATEEFYTNSCESSLNVPIYFQDYYVLLNHQRNMMIAFSEWAELYNKHQPTMKEEIKKLTSEDDYEPMDSEIIKDLLSIFREYVKNLMVESKNRSKYSPILARIDKVIHGLLEEDAGKDSLDGDDIIGTVFERLLINATRCAFLSPIGPAYIYSIFKNRLVKIGNPLSSNINLMLVETNAEDNFPCNDTVHNSCPTVADEAQIYLFDELCDLWTKYDLGEIELSRFLFERVTPFYHDFMLTDSNIFPNESDITHQYVSYPVKIFSNDFLQRAEGAISQVLFSSPEWFDLPISREAWISYLHTTDELGKSAKVPSKGLKKCITECEDIIISELCADGDPSVDYRRHFNAICKVASRERWIEEYAEIFWLDRMGVGGHAESMEWPLESRKFFLRFCDRYLCELEGNEKAKIPMNFSPKAIHAVCFKQLYQMYQHKLLQFSKKVLFQNYTEEQYKQLLLFKGDSPIKVGSCTVTPIHLGNI